MASERIHSLLEAKLFAVNIRGIMPDHNPLPQQPADEPASAASPRGPLRTGFTTGACATAATQAALRLLLGLEVGPHSEITLPRGQKPAFALETLKNMGTEALAAVIKDAGDDPDVTHGARIQSRVRRTDEPGLILQAGPGVGTVTRRGLALAVGEPAINPVPRLMLSQTVEKTLAEAGLNGRVEGGFAVEISVDDGEALAQKTMNGRIGIVGGLSILGTTGIVRPYSCASWIASIHQGIDVARENGIDHLAAATGSTSERAMRTLFNLPDMALIEMGDFVGALFKHLRRRPIKRLTIAGGFGKLSKLAQGHLDLHSGKSAIDFSFLARAAEAVGADRETSGDISACHSAGEALEIADGKGVPLADEICRLARDQALSYIGSTETEVWMVDRQGRPAAHWPR